MDREARGHFCNGNQAALMITWFPEMTETLVAMRSQGISFTRCAEVIGVSTDAAIRKARKLGLWEGKSK